MDFAFAPKTQVQERRAEAKSRQEIKRLAIIGNYPPRRCGIATFTADIYRAVTDGRPGLTADVYAMDDGRGPYDYPAEVTYSLGQNRIDDYLEAARRINTSGAEVILLQHEFGIFGGRAGDMLLRLLEASHKPLVTTLHTVLERPDPDQARVLRAIIARSSRVVVMAVKGREILRRVYGVDPTKIVVVPHGAPDRPLTDTEGAKPALGLEGRKVMLTFGLLSPGKGLENAISALPAVVQKHPDLTYVLLGATHPHLVAHEGEAYRERLAALAESLGVGANVRFVNEFVDTPKLLDYLTAADLYVTPYLNEAQITSGTLAYAVALGKPVISTPYWHAQELLAGGRGVLTPFGDVEAMSEAMQHLLDDDEARGKISALAYQAGRATTWASVGDRYMETLTSAREGELIMMPADMRARPPMPNLTAVKRLTDDCGIAQHSLYGVPDRRHGYCLDDAARGLILACEVRGLIEDDGADALAFTYSAFVQHAWNPDLGRFRNFMSYDRRWLEDVGSSDSFGRAVWALGVTAANGARDELRFWARALLAEVMPHALRLTSPRSLAYCLLGLTRAPEMEGRDEAIRQMAGSLAAKLSSDPEWTWFEEVLSYDNARLPEALLRAGQAVADPEYVAAGLKALEWLSGLEVNPTGCYRPVGTQSFGRRKARPSAFDQQPLEAAAMVDACAAALACGEERWSMAARRAYDWFLGRNDLGARMAREDGACYDGLSPYGPNLNQGAESILAFQMATCTVNRLTRMAPPVSVGVRH